MRRPFVMVFVVLVSVSNTSDAASCRNMERLWNDLKPVSAGIGNSSSSLIEILNAAPKDQRNTAATVIVAYEANAAMQSLSSFVSLVGLQQIMKNSQDRKAIEALLEQELLRVKKQFTLSMKTMNTQVAQFDRPALVQQGMAVRTSLASVLTVLDAECPA